MILTLLIVVLVVLSVLYVLWIGLSAPPQWSLYAYVGIWLVVPKALRLTYLTGGRYDLPTGVTVFNILEAITAAGILVALLSRPRPHVTDGSQRSLRRLCVAFVLVTAVCLAASATLLGPLEPASMKSMATFLGQVTNPQDRILPALSALYALLFVFGCLRFLRTMRQVEILMWLFALSGVELALERIVFVNLKLFPALQHYAVQVGNRLGSLVFTSYDFVGVFAIVSLSASLFLAMSGKRLAWLTFGCGLIPLFGGYQRAPVFGAIVAAAVVIGFLTTGRMRLAILSAIIVLGGTIVTSNVAPTVLKLVGQSIGGQVRANYFETESVSERVALFDRALQTFTFVFPSGVGAGMGQYAMSYPIPNVGPPNVQSTAAVQLYVAIERGRQDAAHDLFFEVMMDFGALGIVMMVAFGATTIRLFRRRLRPISSLQDLEASFTGRLDKSALRRVAARRQARRLQVCSFAMLGGLLGENLLNYDQLPYFIYVLPLALIVVAGAIERRSAPSRDPVPAPSRRTVPAPARVPAPAA